MGGSKITFIGAYFVVNDFKWEFETTRRRCPKGHEHINDNFCPMCGSKIEKVPELVTKNININAIDDQFSFDLLDTFDMIPSSSVVNTFEYFTGRDDDSSIEVNEYLMNDIGSGYIEEAKQRFQQKYSTELKEIEKITNQKITVRFGAMQYYW